MGRPDGMITQHLVACEDGRVLCRIAASDATVVEILSTGEELAQCRAFLMGASGATTDRVRMGEFGPFEVALARGADDWSVRILIGAAAINDGSQLDQHISTAMGRAELLKALEGSPSSQSPSQPAAPPRLSRTARSDPPRHRAELHTAADIRRLVFRLAIPRKQPRIVVGIGAFTDLEQQRMQTRITGLAEARQSQSGGPVAAAAVLLLGAAHLIRTLQREWMYVLWLVLATAGAWLLGRWLGALWCRLRLQLALLRLWRRVRSLERGKS